MSPGEVASVIRLKLAADIDRDLRALRELAERAATLHQRLAADNTDWVCALALAFEVERYYTGLEALLERLLGELDGQVVVGPRRHQEVLRAALTAVEPHRPALLPAAIAADLRELLGFRHLARHAYEIEPDPQRMLGHGARLGRVHGAIEAHFGALASRLRADAAS
jgi:hypothetical protein